MEIQYPNLLAAYGQGVQLREAEREIGGRNALTNALNAGDAAGARTAYNTLDPVGAYQASQPKPVDPKEMRAMAAQLTGAVLEAPDHLRPQVWAEVLDIAADSGLDVSGLSPDYDERRVTLMNRIFSAPEEKLTDFQRKLAMLPEDKREEAMLIEFGLAPRATNETEKDPLAALRARAAEGGLQPGSPEYRQFMIDGGAKSGLAVDVGPNGEVSVRSGSIAGEGGFGKAAVNELEKGVISDGDLIQRGARLMQDYKPEYLTYQGQFESFITKQAEKLGRDPSEVRKEALKGRQRFVMGIEQLFNQYRKEITGAAAAVAELERLKKSFINMDMSPSEFESGMELFMEESARALRLKRKLLREGVPATDLGSLLDDAFLGGQDDDPAARFGEIMQEVGDEGEAYRRLAAEGYRL